jgi:hypothetical protein
LKCSGGRVKPKRAKTELFEEMFWVISSTDETCERYTLRNIEYQRKSLSHTGISNSVKQQDRADAILLLRVHFTHFIRKIRRGTDLWRDDFLLNLIISKMNCGHYYTG